MNQSTNAFDRAINNRIATVTFIDLDVLLEVLEGDVAVLSAGSRNLLRKVVNQVFASKCNRSVRDTISGYRLEDLLSDSLIELSRNPEYGFGAKYSEYVYATTSITNAHRHFTGSAVLPLNTYVRDTYR
jgi:hypothetical protein